MDARVYTVMVCSGCGEQSSWNENGYWTCPNEWGPPPPGESGPRRTDHSHEQVEIEVVPLEQGILATATNVATSGGSLTHEELEKARTAHRKHGAPDADEEG